MDWRYHILQKTGYSLYKKLTGGMTLEFVGTSGVGKTTLFHACMPKLRDRWFFAYHLEFLKRKIPSNDIDAALMKVLQNRIDKINGAGHFCPWHSLLDLKLSLRVMHETMLIAQLEHPQGFAFDEGLFRHFPAEILQMGDEFPVELWKNRAFVYLRAQNPETTLARLKSREANLSQIERQRERTDEQFLANIERDQGVFQSIVDKASTFGCPVLVIDAENPFQDSVEQVMLFESSLSERFGRQDVNKPISNPIS